MKIRSTNPSLNHKKVHKMHLTLNVMQLQLQNVLNMLAGMLYQPQNNVDGEDSGDSSKGQALQDAAAGVRAITSLCCAVLLHQ